MTSPSPLSPTAEGASAKEAPFDLLGLGGDRHVMKQRITIGLVVLGLILCLMISRLVWFAALHEDRVANLATTRDETTSASRPVIHDRRGNELASDVMISSLGANPKEIVALDETIEKLLDVFPDLDEAVLRHRLTQDREFVWIRREVTPYEKAQLHEKGIAGIEYRRETKRVYPAGRTSAHVVGFVGIDNQGLHGIEADMDRRGLRQLQLIGLANKADLTPVDLTIDLSVQHAVRDELSKGLALYGAKAAGGLVMDVHSGEIIALVSLPDFDPLQPPGAEDPGQFNLMTRGAYELGSVMKTFTAALALDSGIARRESILDARRPLVKAGITVDDYHGKKRFLTFDEMIIYSSNIAAAQVALELGAERLVSFYKKLGMIEPPSLEIPEVAGAILPAHWLDSSLITAGFGHGINFTPLQALKGFSTLVNGGFEVKPRLLLEGRKTTPERLIDEQTSIAIREMLRLNVIQGTARQANKDPGYRIGGKTGTADKLINKSYADNKIMTSFLGAFPMNKPRYSLYILYDEPVAEIGKPGRTAGYNAVPTAATIIARIAPLLNVPPNREAETGLRLRTLVPASEKESRPDPSSHAEQALIEADSYEL